MEKTILFHCAPVVLDENDEVVVKANGKVAKGVPTHTLAFTKLNSDLMIMGWAVAHSELDMYCKKTGREIAEDRINLTEADIANMVEILEVGELSMEELPHVILSENFDFYLGKAIDILFDENEQEDGIALMFRSINDELTGIDINFDEIVDEELAGEKDDDNLDTADFIFATFENADGEVIVHLQNKTNFSENGYSDVVDSDMADTLVPVVNDGEFFIVDDQQPIIGHDAMTEVEVIRFLKAKGLAYSLQLEETLLA